MILRSLPDLRRPRQCVLGLFALSVKGMRLIARRESKESLGRESRPDRPSPGSGATRVPVTGMVATGSYDPVYRMTMNNHTHLVEFIAWMRDHGFAGRYSAAQIGDYYDWFTRDIRAFPIPVATLLTALNKHPGVKKKRDRIKCPRTGKVLKLASGTPQRTTYYTISEVPAVHVSSGVLALPGKKRQGKPAPQLQRRTGRVQGGAAVANDPDEILIGYEVAA